MSNTFRELSIKTPSAHCRLFNARPSPAEVDLDSAATSLMVDFTRVPATTANASISVNAALELMKANRIRALMIVDHRGEFAGVATAMDLMGRKPMVFASEAGIPRDEVQVRNVMSPKTRLKAVSLQDISRSTVGDVLHTLRKFSEQHIMVVDGEGNDMQICGMFSASDFKRALEISLEPTVTANSFADLERVIHEHKEVL